MVKMFPLSIHKRLFFSNFQVSETDYLSFKTLFFLKFSETDYYYYFQFSEEIENIK